MRKLLALVAGAVLAAPTVATAGNRTVTMSGNRFQPATLLALVGDTVTWTNRDPVVHNATARDGSWTTGDLSNGQTSAPVSLNAEGTVAYLCTHHSTFMFGTIRVAQLHLSAPATPAAFGRRVVLTGLAPEWSSVSIRRLADGATVATTTASAQGAFSVTLPSPVPGGYQATAAGRTSRAVRIAVRPRVRLRMRRASRGVVVASVSTTPGQAGARVALERARGRGWTRIASRRLDSRSRASFRFRASRTMRIRARLVRPVGGYAAATSAAVAVRR